MEDNDENIILELYKTSVDMADRMSARRAGANSFFLTLNTALAAVVGIVSSARKPPPHGNLPTFDAYGLVLTAIAGVVLSLTWQALLRYYRRLSKAKFDVINKIEESLPVKPYTDEWAILHPPAKPGESPTKWTKWWRRTLKHREATVVEQVVPLVFVAIYVALAIRVLA